MGYTLATLGPLAKSLWENHPDLVENYYRYDGVTSFVSKGDKVFREGLQIGDSTLLGMYGFDLLYGNPQEVFEGPYSILITKDKAIKYFGHADVIGQSLTIENFSGAKHDFQITGVLDKLSRNSVTHLVDDYPNSIFLSVADLSFFGRNMDWNNTSIAAFLELKPGVAPQDLDKPIEYLVKQNTPREINENLTPYLVPLKKYYLTANNGLVRKMLNLLSLIAGFILLMAVINFVNISLGRSSVRKREIGIRKVLGGLKRQLMIQFLSESTLLVVLAALFSLGLYQILKIPMSRILLHDLPNVRDFPPVFIPFLVVLIIVVGFLAGIYPAMVLSSMSSVNSLKSKWSTGKESGLMKKILIAIQFCTAATVIIGAISISKQIQFFFSQQLGYDKEYIVSAQVPRDWSPEGTTKMEYVRRQFAVLPQVKDVTLSYEVPDGNNSGNISIYLEGSDSASAVNSQLLMTDEHYASTYSIALVAGEYFQPKGLKPDSTKIVINETQAKVFGWLDAGQAVGKRVRVPGMQTSLTVAGVIRDFHFGSMQKAIPPVVILPLSLTNTFRYFSFKLKPGHIGESLSQLQKQWAALLPGTSFEYKFLDDLLNKLYKSEIQLKRATWLATVLSLFIALLGVLGLVSQSIYKKTREIGIRKVLGATSNSIIRLFINEFLPVIAVAALVACPLAWYLLEKWLAGYAYRIEISVIPFVISILGLTVLTILLIAVQTLKTSLENPVEALKGE